VPDSSGNLNACKILVVDDNPANVLLVIRLLEHGGFQNIRSTYDAEEVLPIYQEWKPDLIVLDLHMPKMTGYQVMAQLNAVKPPDEFVPILVFTADVTSDAKRMALEAGAADFLTKPGDATEIMLRVRNFLRMRLLTLALTDQNRLLEDRVRERTRELEGARLEVIERLALAAEYRDDDTGEHAKRVGEMSARIAEYLGLSPDEVEAIRLAARLHDLGKIGISDSILLKPGRLTEQEFEQMKEHTRIGARVLNGSSVRVLQLAETIALTHHERWDGAGYPNGIQGEQIPLCGRIVAVADVYDALCSVRLYKPALTHAEAVAEIERHSGSHFDPRVVQAFLACYGQPGTSESELPLAA
jgi:putative two-component system response regulator